MDLSRLLSLLEFYVFTNHVLENMLQKLYTPCRRRCQYQFDISIKKPYIKRSMHQITTVPWINKKHILFRNVKHVSMAFSSSQAYGNITKMYVGTFDPIRHILKDKQLDEFSRMFIKVGLIMSLHVIWYHFQLFPTQNLILSIQFRILITFVIYI